MTLARQSLGRSGEDLACAELERRGLQILARRYRTRAGELDIVARDGRIVVFVEVKTRASPAFGAPAEAVTGRKRAQLRRMANDFLWRAGLLDEPCRFDVVAVTMSGSRDADVLVFADAFGDE